MILGLSQHTLAVVYSENPPHTHTSAVGTTEKMTRKYSRRQSKQVDYNYSTSRQTRGLFQGLFRFSFKPGFNLRIV